MYTTIVILILLASVLMCLIVLIQESKGGGLAADYASGNQLLGAPKTSNVIEKATWSLAAIMVVLSIVSVAFLPSSSAESSVMQMEQAAPAAIEAPAAPQAEPAQGQQAPVQTEQAPAQ